MAHRVLVALLFIIVVTVPLGPTFAGDCEGTITAHGIGKTKAKPDVGFVTLHVQGAGLLMEDAYRDATGKAAAITKAIREKHPAVISVDQTTLDLKQKESEPWRSDREPEGPKPVVVLRIRVTIPPDQNLAISVVDTGIRAGASLIDPVSQRWVGVASGAVLYGLKASQQAVTEALDSAFADARANAQQAATAGGMLLGGITAVGCREQDCTWSDVSYTAGLSLPVKYFSADPEAVDVTATACVSYQLLSK